MENEIQLPNADSIDIVAYSKKDLIKEEETINPLKGKTRPFSSNL